MRKSIKEKNKVVKMDRESVKRGDDNTIIGLSMDLWMVSRKPGQFEISELRPLEIPRRLPEWASECQNRDLD